MNENLKRLYLSMIPHGAENAVSMKAFASISNLSLRDARRVIYEMRCSGALICSGTDVFGNSGYYQPVSIAEVERYVAFQEHRIIAAARAVRSARLFLRQHKEGDSDC